VGIGLEIAKGLLSHNAKVYIASRNFDKAEMAIQQLREATGKDAIYIHLDLASLSSVATMAKKFLDCENELHMLYNNGGVYVPPVDLLTENGYDLTFGTNVLGARYLLPVEPIISH